MQYDLKKTRWIARKHWYIYLPLYIYHCTLENSQFHSCTQTKIQNQYGRNYIIGMQYLRVYLSSLQGIIELQCNSQCAWLGIERSGCEPWLGTLCCVLGQDTKLSPPQYLSPPRCINGYQQIQYWGQPCDGQTSHPGESSNIPSRLMLRKPG